MQAAFPSTARLSTRSISSTAFGGGRLAVSNVDEFIWLISRPCSLSDQRRDLPCRPNKDRYDDADFLAASRGPRSALSSQRVSHGIPVIAAARPASLAPPAAQYFEAGGSPSGPTEPVLFDLADLSDSRYSLTSPSKPAWCGAGNFSMRHRSRTSLPTS